MTSTLCEALDRRIEDLDPEAIVEVLAAIGDPAAVPSIEGALWWHRAWDDYHGLGTKCVWALLEIATPEAKAAMAGALAAGPERIRDRITTFVPGDGW